mmetsp:Transcript_17110/g.44387  ORF Transcript_17110/g.44387 Transcript_17110/m.44387 type:complete len:216 (+) Transcript_17110:700-1347(+)
MVPASDRCAACTQWLQKSASPRALRSLRPKVPLLSEKKPPAFRLAFCTTSRAAEASGKLSGLPLTTSFSSSATFAGSTPTAATGTSIKGRRSRMAATAAASLAASWLEASTDSLLSSVWVGIGVSAAPCNALEMSDVTRWENENLELLRSTRSKLATHLSDPKLRARAERSTARWPKEKAAPTLASSPAPSEKWLAAAISRASWWLLEPSSTSQG